jgi:hypothetical protein
VRAEHLKDYLCARRMALRISWYRERQEVVEAEPETSTGRNRTARTTTLTVDLHTKFRDYDRRILRRSRKSPQAQSVHLKEVPSTNYR